MFVGVFIVESAGVIMVLRLVTGVSVHKYMDITVAENVIKGSMNMGAAPKQHTEHTGYNEYPGRKIE